MMKLASMTAALLISLSTGSFGQQTGTVAIGQEIRKAIEQFSQAFVEADVSRLDSLLAEDYVHTNSNGSVLNKRQWLEYIKTRKRDLETGRLKVESYENKDLSIRVYGETAVVTGHNIAHGQREGAPFVTELRFTHLWVSQRGQWKRAAFHDSALAK